MVRCSLVECLLIVKAGGDSLFLCLLFQLRFLIGFVGAWESGHGQISSEHILSCRHHILVCPRVLYCEGISDLDDIARCKNRYSFKGRQENVRPLSQMTKRLK
jgi:hypothetical protein